MGIQLLQKVWLDWRAGHRKEQEPIFFWLSKDTTIVASVHPITVNIDNTGF